MTNLASCRSAENRRYVDKTADQPHVAFKANSPRPFLRMHPLVGVFGLVLLLGWIGWFKIFLVIALLVAVFVAMFILGDRHPESGLMDERQRTDHGNGVDLISRTPPNPASRSLVSSSTVLDESSGAGLHPESGLIIRPEPLREILSGRKTWEMRSVRTNKRGPIALIEKGGNRILGVAHITGVLGPLSAAELKSNLEQHQISLSRLDDDPKVKELKFAWTLANVTHFAIPIPFSPRNGAVRFVTLTPSEKTAIASALGAA
ncbi:ASCH domain-containing protein [Paucibacter sp. O1-1]|nr:ASCH domain-containing protein [Paucibacter sp. O1-1]MDA3825421.1 ASCH domain-containing protein [Paucibacter sp. O1-1]